MEFCFGDIGMLMSGWNTLYLFYKFFEDQFDCFKLSFKLTLDADAGRLSGQWYEVDTKDLQTSTRLPDSRDDFTELGLRLDEAAQLELTKVDSEAVVASKETPPRPGVEGEAASEAAKGGRTAGGKSAETPGGIDNETGSAAVGVEREQGRVGVQHIKQNCRSFDEPEGPVAFEDSGPSSVSFLLPQFSHNRII
jgi:hypothetical protein